MSGRPSVPLAEATVAIVGLGLMGSSLGLALDGRCARRVGVERDRTYAERSHARGAVDAVDELEGAVASADLVVLALPVGATVGLAGAVAAAMRSGAILTDVASTKGATCAALDELPVRSIGGHPMCGGERSGPEAARADLYVGATWALCPTRTTTDAVRAAVVELVEAVGAAPFDIARDDHDEAAAAASHLPYVVAQALLPVLARADASTGGAASRLVAGGFGGATRLAGGSVAMWRDILASNAGNVGAAIDALREELALVRRLLDEPHALERRLQDGRDAHGVTRIGSPPA